MMIPSQMPQQLQSQGQFMQASQGGQPPMSPQSGAPAPQGQSPPTSGPSQPPSPMNPQVIMQMIMTLPPQIRQMLAQQVLQQAAGQGRGGDTMIAHLTPGEKTVPPEIQTPKVLATLNRAYKDKGVSPQQFTAGTPQSSQNPKTGLPEYNFASAFLPAALGIGASIVAPEFMPAVAPALAGAIGGGIGSAAGGLATGQSPTQAALTGLGSGAGSYLGSGLMAGASGGADAADNGFIKAAQTSAGVPVTGLPGAAGSSAISHAPVLGSQMLGNAVGNFNPMSAAGGALGGYIGNSIGAPQKSNAPAYPNGFNNSMPSVGSLGSAQQQLGMPNSVQPRPNFTGYNPMTNSPGSFNFFPGSQ